MQNKYPLWKNLALICIAVLGLIYAIPNLYTEHPVVQISSDTEVDKDVLKQEIEALLQKSNLEYSSIITENEGVEVIFSSTRCATASARFNKTSLGSQYTVALNLAPSTHSG